MLAGADGHKFALETIKDIISLGKLIIQKEYDEKYFDALKEEMSRTPKVDPNSKIIFLDVDGVLNSGEWIDKNPKLPSRERIDPAAVARVNNLIAKTGAKIVISSSWRTGFLGLANGFSFLTEFFGKFGITQIVGMTPSFLGKPRREEIIAWLKEHPVASFVILDDDEAANVLGRQIRTHFEDGLQDSHVERAVAVLQKNL